MTILYGKSYTCCYHSCGTLGLSKWYFEPYFFFSLTQITSAKEDDTPCDDVAKCIGDIVNDGGVEWEIEYCGAGCLVNLCPLFPFSLSSFL